MKLQVTVGRIHIFPWRYTADFCNLRIDFHPFHMAAPDFCPLGQFDFKHLYLRIIGFLLEFFRAEFTLLCTNTK